jgi:hypothetical protein
MTRLLHLIVVILPLFTATVATSGIDLGAENCHSHATEQHPRLAGGHSDGPQLTAACYCSCPCCTYVAHLIPLSFSLVFASSPAPEILYTSLQVGWFSLAISPPIRPPAV